MPTLSPAFLRSPVLVAGGSIGGIAAALALAHRGFDVKVLEQAAQLGEIGAGIQLGPNGFSAFDALGVGERARARRVHREMVMRDALDAFCVGRIPTGEAFRARFRNPCAVSTVPTCTSRCSRARARTFLRCAGVAVRLAGRELPDQRVRFA